MTTPADPREARAGERTRAVTLATWALDRPNADPDDDLNVISRQFLRAIDRLAARQDEPSPALRSPLGRLLATLTTIEEDYRTDPENHRVSALDLLTAFQEVKQVRRALAANPPQTREAEVVDILAASTFMGDIRHEPPPEPEHPAP